MSTTTTYTGCTACCLGTTGGCAQCAAAPLHWTLTVAGIGQISTLLCASGQCNNLNGSFTCNYSSGCEWHTPQLACGNPAWQVQYDAVHSKWRLNGASAFVWSIAAASFNCLGTNVMTFDAGLTSSSDCNNLPATITITPA